MGCVSLDLVLFHVMLTPTHHRRFNLSVLGGMVPLVLEATTILDTKRENLLE